MIRFFRKGLALYLSTTLLIGPAIHGFETAPGLWQDRRQNLEAINPELPPQLFHPPQRVPASEPANAKLFAALPRQDVIVREIHGLDSTEETPVILVQDIHMNEEAQFRIADLLKSIIDGGLADVIGVEGAFGPFDFNRFRSFPDALKEEITRQFLKANELAAPSYAGITAENTVPLITGVDDSAHYEANRNALMEALSLRIDLEKNLKEENIQLQLEKGKFLSSSLRTFDLLRQSYRSGDISLGRYVNSLSSFDNELTPALMRYLLALQAEASVNIRQANEEREHVITELSAKLPLVDIQELINMSLAFRENSVGFGDYYRLVKKLCVQNGISLHDKPAFHKLIETALLADDIDVSRVLQDLNDVEEKIIRGLAESNLEVELMNRTDRHFYKQKMARLTLTPSDWESYKSHFPEEPAPLFSPFESFYVQADIRSERMISNLMTIPSRRPRVLVAGGYHTNLMAEWLRQRKKPYIVLSPRLTTIEKRDGAAYLSAFHREKSPLESLFSDETLFIAPPHLAVGTGQPETRAADASLRALLATKTANAGQEVPKESGVVVRDKTEAGQRVTVDGIDVIVNNGKVRPAPQSWRKILANWTRPARALIAGLIDPRRKDRIINAEKRADQEARFIDMDKLTHVANAAALKRALPGAEADAEIAVILFDANNFGQINKVFSQEAGDMMIREIASAVREAAAESDVSRVFRKGGDEFVVLAPTHIAEIIRLRAERIFGYQKLGEVIVSLSGSVGQTLTEADSKLQGNKADRKKGVANLDESQFIRRNLDELNSRVENIQVEHETPSLVPIPEPKTIFERWRRWSGDRIDPEGKVEYMRVERRRDISRRMAERDPLTKFGNRTALDRALPAAESNPDLSIIAFDANNFGKINKIASHAEGDLMLARIAAAIRQAAAEFDNARIFQLSPFEAAEMEATEGDIPLAYRRGGDEFVIIARTEFAEDIKNRAETLFGVHIVKGSGDHKNSVVTVSLTGTVAKTFAEADGILQAAKKNRKDQIEKTHPFPPASILDWKVRSVTGNNFNIRYLAYTLLLVNWEFVFAAPVYLWALVGPAYLSLWIGLPLTIASAVVFSKYHRDYDISEKQTVFLLGVVYAGIFLIPGIMDQFGWTSFFLSMGLHSVYNAAAVIFGWTKSSTNGREWKSTEWDALRRFINSSSASPNELKTALIRVVGNTPLKLNIGNVKEDQYTLTHLTRISSLITARLERFVSEDQISVEEARIMGITFSTLLRSILTGQAVNPHLTAGSVRSLLWEMENRKEAGIPKPSLVYQFIDIQDPANAAKQARLTMLEYQHKNRHNNIKIGFVFKNDEARLGAKELLHEYEQTGEALFLSWDAASTLRNLNAASEQILAGNATIGKAAAKSFMENADYRLLLPPDVTLPGDFLSGFADSERVRFYLLITSNLTTIQFNPMKMDELKNLTEIILRQA